MIEWKTPLSGTSGSIRFVSLLREHIVSRSRGHQVSPRRPHADGDGVSLEGIERDDIPSQGQTPELYCTIGGAGCNEILVIRHEGDIADRPVVPLQHPFYALGAEIDDHDLPMHVPVINFFPLSRYFTVHGEPRGVSIFPR